MKRLLLLLSLIAFTLTINAQNIDTIYTSNPVECNGDCDGEITVVTNATGNVWFDVLIYVPANNTFVTYQVPGSGSSTFTIDNLCAAQYRVRTLDFSSGSIIDSEDYILFQPGVIMPMPNYPASTDVLCNGGSDGTASLVMMGGTPPFTFSWDNGYSNIGDTSINIGLSAGNYLVTVSDSNGCLYNGNPIPVTVNEPSTSVTNSAFVVDVACYGDSTGQIDIIPAGGTSPYSFSWTGPMNYNSTEEDIDSLIAGTYQVVVTDANGCNPSSFTTFPAFQNITVSQPNSPLSVSHDSVNVSCLGGNNGEISLTAFGGTPASSSGTYNYSWYNLTSGLSLPLPHSNNVIGLTAGEYIYEVIDQNLCVVSDTVTISQPLTSLTVIMSSDSVGCFGGFDGSVTATVNGGDAPYSYQWSNTQGILYPPTNNTYSTFDVLGQLVTGDYFVSVTDSNGCVVNSNITLFEPLTISGSFTLDSISCPTGTDGVLSIQTSGGTPPYNYSWSADPLTNPLGFGHYPLNSNSIDSVSSGYYTVAIQDDNGCQTTFSTTVTEPSPLSHFRQEVPVSCHGGSDGQVLLTISGGTTPYTYSWTSTSNPSFDSTLASISGLPAGIYSCIVEDANNCYALLGGYIVTATITQPQFPVSVPVSNLITSNVVCNGQSTGSISVTPSGGIPPYSFVWSNGFNSSGLTSIIAGIPAGTYSVDIRDANQCLYVESGIQITEPAGIIPTLSANPPTCNGFADASVTAFVSGGTPPYSYLWSNGDTTASINGLNSGQYDVLIFDATQACNQQASIFINDPSPILVDITQPINVSCNGADDGILEANPIGGTGGYSYSWTGQNGFSDTTRIISNLSAGIYGLVVTDTIGCNQSNFTVSPNTNLVNTVTITEPALILLNEVVTNISANGANDGSILLAPTGGTPLSSGTNAYTYSWTLTGPSIHYPNGFSSSLSSINNLSPATFEVTVTDYYGCEKIQSFSINEPACNLTLDTAYLSPLCYGDLATLEWEVSNGVGPYTSSLQDSSGLFWYPPSSSSTIVNMPNLPQGFYTLLVSDQSGCQNVLNIPIVTPDSLEINFSSTEIDCYGYDDATLSAIVSGGTPYFGGSYSYLWQPNNQSSLTLINLVAGTYTVIVTDANGCTKTGQHTINQPDLLVVDSTISTMISCSSGFDGTASVYLSGGTTPYSYSWPMPNFGLTQTTQTASYLSVAGTYTVDVTDNNGCTTDSQVDVSHAPILNLSDSVIQPLCNGDTSGMIFANASGGTFPYTYAWTENGITFPSQNSFIANLGAGTYSVTVVDAMGCDESFSRQIINPPTLSVTSTQINVSLNGANDGSIDILVAGGTGSGTYSYNWYGPNGFTSTQEDITNLYAGTYNLIIFDANGCQTSYSQVINEPACNLAFDSTLTFITQPACFGQQGQINWSAYGGGQTLFPTRITNNQTGTILFNQTTVPSTLYNENLSDGNYNLYVEDEYGCSDILNFSIVSPNLLTANISTDSVLCFGGATGSMLIEGVGGTPPYVPNYGTHPTTGAPLNENALTAGTYTVTLTDANGCQATPTFYTVEIFEPNQLQVIYSTDSTSCYGAGDGSISLNVFGGSSPYTYTWGGNLLGTTTPIVSNLTANTYYVDVTDDHGCFTNPQTTQINVPGPSNYLNASINPTDASCFGLSDGQATVFPTGGTAPFSYVWSDGQTTQTAIGLSLGNYDCTIIDANGCITNASTQISQPNEILTNFTVTDISCFGLGDGSASVNPLGGSGTGFTVEWSIINPLTLLPLTSLNVSNLTLGIYNVRVTDNSLPGCDIVTNFTISQPDILQINPVEEQIVSCFQGTFSNDGSLSVDVLGGVGPYTYNWSTNINNSVATSNLVTNLTSQMYYVEVVDSNSCSILDSIFLNTNAEILPNLTFDNVSCHGGSDGIAFANPSGGVAPYTYFWSPSGDTTSSITQLNGDSLYVVQISDANSCDPITVGFYVPQPDSITTYVTIDSVSCYNGSDGQINIDSIFGPMPPYSFLWSNGQTDTLANNLSAGSYNCVVTDDENCSYTLLFDVFEPNEFIGNITVTSSFNGSNITCPGSSDGELTASATGGNGTYTYLWSTGATTSTINGLSAGTYGVDIFDANQCSTNVQMTLVDPDAIQINYSVSDYNGNNISCHGFNDGTFSAHITGGAIDSLGFQLIVWTDNAGNLISPNNILNDTTIINVPAGTYNISVTDFNGCSATSSITLTEPNVLVNYFITDSVTCNGGSDGVAYSNVSGGTSPYNYSWSGSSSDSSSAHGLMANSTYTISVQDNNGCPILLENISVPEPDAISLSTIQYSPTCNGFNDGQIIVDIITGGTGGYSYQWSNGQSGTILNNLYGDSLYSVVITDGLNCVDSSYSVFLPQPLTLQAEISITTSYNGTDVQCYGDQNGDLLATATGGSGSYTYLWNTGATTNTLNNIGSGIYTVYITDVNGVCTDLDTVIVEDPDSISFNYTTSNYNGSDISCTDSLDGFIDVVISGGNGIDPNTIIWNIGSTSTNLNNLGAGFYELTVADSNQCSNVLAITLTQPDTIAANPGVISTTCNGGSDGAAFVAPTGGTAPYGISWSTGEVTDTIFGLSALAPYLVQVSDVNNCPLSFHSVNILQPAPIQTTENITLPTCNGVNDGQIIITSVTGNTAPYTYEWNDSTNTTGMILSNLYSGEYVCTITDAIGCIEDITFLVDTVFVVEAIGTINSNFNGTDVSCYGASDGEIIASGAGGTPPYTYNWTSGQTTDTISNLVSGVYAVFVQDANGCSDLVSINIEDPDSITALINTSDYNGFEISCDGLSDGSVTAIASGGNGINSNTLLWDSGDTLTTLSGLPVGTYSYTIEDINGCSASATVLLTSPNALQLDLSSDTLSCNGDTNASAYIDSLYFGIQPFTYLWNNGQNTATATNLSSGLYSLEITDANNCNVISSIDVTEPNPLASTLSINSSFNGYDVSCFDSFDGEVTVSTTGGTAPYLYSTDSLIPFFSNNLNYTGLSSGNFHILTLDNNGCESISNVDLISPDQLFANLSVTIAPTCLGVDDGIVTSAVSGGALPHNFSWSNNSSTINIVSNIGVGIQSVVITDNNGCSINDSISLLPVTTLSSNFTTTQVTCTGSADGTANINVLGGSAPLTYLWDNGQTSSNAIGLLAGNYNVTVTDNNGCVLTDSVVITESDSALSVSSSVSNLNCFQDSSGSISIVVSGGIGDYTYSWSNGETTSSLNNIGASTYILNVTDSVNCIVTETFNITEPALLQHVLSSSNISCFGLGDGSSNVTVSGGTAPYTYNWYGPANYSSSNSNIDLLTNGVYYVVVNDVNGCSLNDSINIIEPLPLVTVVSSVDPLCYNSSDGSITVNVEGGVPPYSSNYGMINPTNILPDTIIYQNLSSGTKVLSVFDSNNCENSYSITLINPLELVIDNVTTNDPSCYNYSNGNASINTVGGTLPYNYQLLDQNNNILTGSSNNTNLQFGDYNYVVIDANACDDTISFTINNPEEITITASSVVDVNCFGANTGLLEVDVNNFIGSYEIIWSPIEYNSDSTIITDLVAGKYDAVVIDELGCTKLDSFFIVENEELTASISVMNSSCKLNADGLISIDNISGGIGPFNIYNNSVLVGENISSIYTIESLLTTDDIDPYTLVISDSYNCQFITQVDVGFDGGYACVDEPVIITPNFDGYNDQWIPILDLDIEIEVDILNRWGQKEYRYTGNSLSFSWNGKANWGGESELPSADYYYIIKFNNDDYPAKTGVITLIR